MGKVVDGWLVVVLYWHHMTSLSDFSIFVYTDLS